MKAAAAAPAGLVPLHGGLCQPWGLVCCPPDWEPYICLGAAEACQAVPVTGAALMRWCRARVRKEEPCAALVLVQLHAPSRRPLQECSATLACSQSCMHNPRTPAQPWCWCSCMPHPAGLCRSAGIVHAALAARKGGRAGGHEISVQEQQKPRAHGDDDKDPCHKSQ